MAFNWPVSIGNRHYWHLLTLRLLSVCQITDRWTILMIGYSIQYCVRPLFIDGVLDDDYYPFIIPWWAFINLTLIFVDSILLLTGMAGSWWPLVEIVVIHLFGGSPSGKADILSRYERPFGRTFSDPVYDRSLLTQWPSVPIDTFGVTVGLLLCCWWGPSNYCRYDDSDTLWFDDVVILVPNSIDYWRSDSWPYEPHSNVHLQVLMGGGNPDQPWPWLR